MPFSLLQPAHGEHDGPVIPAPLCAPLHVSRRGDKLFRIHARMQQADAFVGQIPHVPQELERVATVGDSKLGAVQNATGEPGKLTAPGGQLQFLSVGVAKVRDATPPFQQPPKDPLRQALSTVQDAHVFSPHQNVEPPGGLAVLLQPPNAADAPRGKPQWDAMEAQVMSLIELRMARMLSGDDDAVPRGHASIQFPEPPATSTRLRGEYLGHEQRRALAHLNSCLSQYASPLRP